MRLSTSDKLMYSFLAMKEELNNVGSALLGRANAVFAPQSLDMPRFDPPELGFLRVVSLLYVVYFEVGKIAVEFLTDKVEGYSLDQDRRAREHVELVGKLRTYLQHNMDPTKDRNRQNREHCERWFQTCCGTRVPGSVQEMWDKCLLALLKDAVHAVGTLLAVTRAIEGDGSVQSVIGQWIVRIDRFHAPHEYDAIVEQVAYDMGRTSFDSVRFRKRFYESWNKDLEALDGKYDFSIEARKRVEHSILTETMDVLPVTGKDIMDRFCIGPGKEIGELLEAAREEYQAAPCTKEVLLEKLAARQTSKP